MAADSGTPQKGPIAPSAESSRTDRLFPTLTPDHAARVKAHGRIRPVVRGEILASAGELVESFFVVTSGSVEIVRLLANAEEIVAVLEPGQFTQLCRGEEVVIVGGGNSAGQAALFLAQTVSRVHILVRAAGLAESMSRYLIRRIEQHPGIVLRPRTEIVTLEGENHLERVSWRDNVTGALTTRGIRHVFSMTGAVPNTTWLDGCVALDSDGFIKTGPDLTDEDLAAARPAAASPRNEQARSVRGRRRAPRQRQACRVRGGRRIDRDHLRS